MSSRFRSCSPKLSVLLVGLLVATTALGCERGQTRSDGGESRAVDSAIEAPEGKTCVRDAECPKYLRCRDKTCQVPPAMTGENEVDTPVVRFWPEGTAAEAEPVAEFYVELATTIETRRTGLMFRPSMRRDWGMLFVYPDEAPRSFWMKNTRIPLDMVFVGADGEIVSILEGTEPQTLTPRRSEGPARFVLELNAGAAEEVGLEPGMQMSVENIPDRHKPTQ